MAQLTPVALKYFTDLKIFSGKYIGILLYIVIGIVISYIVVKFIIQWLKNKNEYYTNVTNIPTTTRDPVISYENPIPTNSTLTKSNKTKALNIFSFVEPNKRPPGHYNESNVDLLVTNGLFTIGSNWLYDLLFVA